MAVIKKISGLTDFTDLTQLDNSDYLAVEDSTTGDIHKVTISELSKAHTHSALLSTASILSSGWDSATLSQTMSIPGVTYKPGKGVILVTPTSRQAADNWCDYGLYLDNTESREGMIRFTCTSIPPMNIEVYVHLVS